MDDTEYSRDASPPQPTARSQARDKNQEFVAIQEGLDGYNISLGGSKGVVEFKNSFNTEQLYYDNGQYHWVLKPLYFKLYLFFEKKLKPHKKTISKVLSKLKR
jgi:hypothetical protein